MAFELLKQNISGKIHFIGIGGIGMSALALLLNKIGVKVQGSDIKKTYVTDKLQREGVDVFLSQRHENISDEISLVIKTSIIKDDNPEIISAAEKNIKVITRANLLAQIMQEKKSITTAGTHGKTSTTALIAAIFAESNLDPTIINGGFMNSFKSNFKLGRGDYLIAESDESDGSFVDLPSFAGIVTNLEPEHLDFYNDDFEMQKSYFERYISQIPDDGICAVNAEDKNLRALVKAIDKSNIATYSTNSENEANFVANNIKFTSKGTYFDVFFNKKLFIKNILLPEFGIHNVSNSLAAIIVANHCKINKDDIKNGLEKYQGVKRRFTKVGEFSGCIIIDDYAHHPTEIRAAISCAKQYVDKGEVALVLQPHKYSRVRDLFDEFCNCIKKADKVFLCDIYVASQGTIPGTSKESLFEAMSKIHDNVVMLKEDKDLAMEVKEFAKQGNIILCAGAGTITNYANSLERDLQAL